VKNPGVESGGGNVPAIPVVATPSRDGFRLRGLATTRLEAFVDAAFAFAVTLLVISIDAIPETIADLLQALKGVPAFGVSFVMIAMFWAAHARWSRRYGLDDTPTTLLSLALVFLTLVYVYPLKITFGVFFFWATGGWLAPPLTEIRGGDDIQIMFIVYGTAFVSLSACLCGLYVHAWRERVRLELDTCERAVTFGELTLYLWFMLIGLLSVATAAVLLGRPSGLITSLPGMMYAFLGLSGVAEWLGRRIARSREAEELVGAGS
jgi:hypothetical protein